MDGGNSQAYNSFRRRGNQVPLVPELQLLPPRDYSGNCIVRTCHEIDNEGIILTVRKDGGEFGALELTETLAHNNVYSYANENGWRKGALNLDAKIDLQDGHHPTVFLEAGGPGAALAVGARNFTISALRKDFISGTGVTLLKWRDNKNQELKLEIHFPPDQQKAIEGLASQNGTSPGEQIRQMVADALRREEDYGRWFREKVREGRAAAERGEFTGHEEVGRMLTERYRG